jgi:hypothetical protein
MGVGFDIYCGSLYSAVTCPAMTAKARTAFYGAVAKAGGLPEKPSPP